MLIGLLLLAIAVVCAAGVIARAMVAIRRGGRFARWYARQANTRRRPWLAPGYSRLDERGPYGAVYAADYNLEVEVSDAPVTVRDTLATRTAAQRAASGTLLGGRTGPR